MNDLSKEENDLSKEENEAAAWYRKAADQGDADAQYHLGVLYGRGFAVERRLMHKAVKWFRKAAEQGHTGAQFYLGQFYHTGWGVARDTGQAAEWYRKAAEQGLAAYWYRRAMSYVRALFIQFLYFLEDRGMERIAALIRTLLDRLFPSVAEQGHMDAQYLLGGDLYSSGVGMESETAYRYRKGKEEDCARAQFELGKLYAEGDGVEPDAAAQAAALFRKAAGQGIAGAQYRLGRCYQYGLGVEQDLGKAADCYHKAASQRHARAQYRLGYSTTQVLEEK